jgi:dTDP-4-amino-4,6-dideoxy-D-galactose acyltransferase
MAGYEPLAWDSDFFGFPIGRVDSTVDPAALTAAVGAADADGVRCLYLLCPGEDDELLAAAIDLGFRPYDVRMELDHRLDEGLAAAAPTDLAVRAATPTDEAVLESIARTRMAGTRFWNDPHFPRDRVADLYAAWLHRGLTTPPERLTLVTDRGEGFVICHLDRAAEVGGIELIAVAVTVERRGLGGALVAAADRAFVDAGMQKATVVTQSRNISAQRLYQRYGYRTSRSDAWLHRWA